ncbi:GntR family transcriptional regulator [Rhodophyticola porphyridii]|uniref:GntR family transcriptional regulator n=2 Tax=Rhodophyticola porphyridii TaxID=1852017 RepID=A0A3L9Y3A2_9RHOB|nr:GntR family transcriptional regulator [Rhodophyticola porphyridii]
MLADGEVLAFMPAQKNSADLAAIPFAELETSSPPAEQIFRQVRDAVLQMQIRPGSLLSETEVGQRFGASRTPVREAFTRLREAGLIVTRPSRGNFVTRLSEPRLREAQFLRSAIETAVVIRLCKIGLGAEHLDRIKMSISGQVTAIADNNDLDFQAQDDRFHTLLAAATGYPRTAMLLAQEKTPLDRLRVLALSDRGHKARLLSEHRDILNAVRARDPAQAQAAMARHLASVLDLIADLRDADGDYFE